VAPESIQSLLALAIGFAVAGLTSAGYQTLTARPLSFRLLERNAPAAAVASVPLLVFGAPFIILRNTIRGRRIEHRPFVFVMIATVVAGLWSLMSGTVVTAGWLGLIRLMG
jgi:hypothetical protein